MNVEQAKELKNTILWEEFCKEIDSRIEGKLAGLLLCKPEDLLGAQKEIMALNEVKNIPQDIIDNNE